LKKALLKKVVFIPTYDYLSNPLFSLIVPLLKGFYNIYFNTNEIISWSREEEEKRKEELLSQFDEYRSIYYTRTRNWIKKTIAVFRYRKKTHEVLDEIDPAVIVTASDMSFSSKLAKVWTNKKDIPLIVLQPAFIDPGIYNDISSLQYRIKHLVFNRLFSIPLALEQKRWGNEYSDNYLLLWGEYFKKMYRGLPIHENIYVTGNPVYDKYFKKDSEKKVLREKVYREYGFPMNRKIVAICTEGLITPEFMDAGKRLNNIYRELVRKRKDLYFVIKLHPRDSLEDFMGIFSDIPDINYSIIKNLDLENLFLISSVQVSICSASSFEAVIAGVPIVLVNPNNMVKYHDVFRNKIELRATNINEFESCIDDALTLEYRENFRKKRELYLSEMIGTVDGGAAERMAKVITKIINERNSV
jgi:hypothetical protein